MPKMDSVAEAFCFEDWFKKMEKNYKPYLPLLTLLFAMKPLKKESAPAKKE